MKRVLRMRDLSNYQRRIEPVLIQINKTALAPQKITRNENTTEEIKATNDIFQMPERKVKIKDDI